MSTNTTTETREFIIVGQDRGTSYCLWDVAPAPTDDTKRAIALEEIGIDAFDAFGSVHTEHATSARAAVDQLVNDLREQSGIGSYGLADDSQLDNYKGELAPAAGEPEPFGRAHTLSATRDSGYRIQASATPGLPHFNVDGLPVRSPNETRDRVRAGIINSGLDWPAANVLVRLTPLTKDGSSVGTSGLDLAIACSVLAAAGHIPADCLAGAALVGELGLDGSLRVPYDLTNVVRTAASGGSTTVIVPTRAVDDAATAGVRVIGAASLDEALAVLTGHWHHPEGCAHCVTDGDADPHQPCTPTPGGLCPACEANAPF
ncbi:magnesium chelatase domain-containing protein [Actinacidiphila sp. ITFR-21]|uniref:magnesium chelatase domain-containing protein n=1 Tax=Actinacidiphila sp. ITFR-21 TaxID=3075199 RepID=UPI0028892C97|nr:magnesium chelatase domain-containing protein [Streptomyces sp. ITFR-21]WNI20392.1 magnesium chelatase domain-containing protein [Streptomyces sp. ITFR-21]